MTFHEFGDDTRPHIMLIHGGVNAWWNYLRQARVLAQHYHVILPTLDGHGEAYRTPYVSTERTADQLTDYIQQHCGGHLFALCGVSLGGQIVIELLARKPDLTEKAIVDGSLCYPQPMMARFCIASVWLFGWMLFSEWACRLQLKLMPKLLPTEMTYPQEIQEYYLRDMPRTPRKTLYTMYRTYMAQYRVKESVRNSHAQVMYWYGEKEMKCVKNSARMFQQLLPTCRIYEVKGYGHGYLSVYLPEEWLRIALPFFEGKDPRACLKIGDVSSSEGFWAAGKQFFRRNPGGFQGKIALSRGQKPRRLGMLTFFKQALMSPANSRT